jgi:hypothetical protein
MALPRSSALAVSGALAVALSGCSSDETRDDAAGGGAPNGGAAGGGTAGVSGASSGGASSGAAGATATGGVAGSNTGGTGPGGSAGSSGATISDGHPGDSGIADDPDVVWAENFEEGSVDAVVARYEQAQNAAGMSLDADVPARSSGRASLRLLSSGDGANATDLFKHLEPGHDELFVRYYAKYEPNVAWHHTGVWIGGYNPPSDWPNPQAGLKPNGDDRFSISLEPLEQDSATPRLDFYNYWMTMHSWMDVPSGDTAYYGNSLVHDPALVATGDWQCIELYVKLNPDGASGAGAELALWVDDEPRARFTDTSPLGYWIKDKFCPDAATGTECTDYRPADPELAPLDLRYRSTTDLELNAFWPQNYITEPGEGSVWYDDMVVARRRIGCLR